MSFPRMIHLVGVAALVVAMPTRARATDGHFLHGVGAVNSALGGAGVAGNASLLGAFFVNPAGLASFSGTHLEMGFELMKAERSVSSSYGPMSGTTTSTSAFSPIPAFGWSTNLNDRVVLGVAGLGIGGFGVDYAADASNPVMMPRPNGFGDVYSNFQLLKIAPAVAWKASSKLRVGVALNVDWATLAVDPMPAAAPAVDPGPDGVPNTADDRAYYSSGSHGGTAFGLGAQIGLQYQVNEQFSVGAAYTSPQFFADFKYNAVYENPNLPNFNTARTFRFRLDAPPVYAAGLAYAPTPALRTALDVKYIGYGTTRGFEASGYNADGSVKGFGWKNIAVVAAGVEYDVASDWTLRGGYNYSGNPIPDEMSMYNIPAPAIVQHHITGGVGYTVRPGVEINLSAYKAFENSISGPMQRPTGAVPGTNVTNTMSETSLLIGFTFAPPKR